MGDITIVSGLEAVPDAAGRSARGGRTRETWSNDDWRLFGRFSKMVRQHGDVVLLRCGNELCPNRAVKLEPDASAERGAVLRCGCTDRVILRR